MTLKHLKQTLKHTFSGKCEINNDYLRSQAPLNVISQINGAEEMLWIIMREIIWIEFNNSIPKFIHKRSCCGGQNKTSSPF